MKRIFKLIFFVSAVLFASCNPADPDNTATLDVKVTPGEAGIDELTFTVTSENAASCAWMCVEDGTTVPSGTDIMQKGKTVFANTEASAKATGLKDNTVYVIVAAAMDEADNILTSTPVKMTTLEKPAEPKVTLSDDAVEGSTFSFKITPADAEKCAYKLYKKSQSAKVDDVLSTGTEVSATESTTVTLENLEDGEYFVVAAAQNGDAKFLSSKLSFMINTAIPSYSINPIKVYCSYKAYNGKDFMVRFVFVDMKGSNSNIALDFVLAESHDYVPAGLYDLGAASAPKLDPEYTEQVITDGINGGFESGTCNVSIKDGKYIFDVNLLRMDDDSFNPGEMLSFTWSGVVEDMPIL